MAETRKKTDFKLLLLLAIPIALLYVLVFVALTSDYLLPGFDPFHYKILNGAYQKELSVEEAGALTKLLSQGIIISPQDLLSNVVNFYTFILQLLLGIMAILGVVAFMSIKLISEEKLESHADKTIKQQLRSREFYDDIQNRISELTGTTINKINQRFSELQGKDSEFDDLAVEIEKVGEIQNEINQIHSLIRTITERISELDSKEGGNRTTIEPPERS